MAQAMAGKLLSRWNSDEMVGIRSDESFNDVIFEFFDNGQSPNWSSSSDGFGEDEEEEDEISCSFEENKKFWESQIQLLQSTLYRTSSLESGIRQATRAALKEINMLSTHCVCRNPVAGGCRNCLQREVSIRLRNQGYNCSICTSKWKTTPSIPAGEHTYLEVVDHTSSKIGEVIRIVIELNFRAEFEMARANEEYNSLIGRLPEVFVGKAERLRALIKILCSAAKKCMKEKKMHMGPWRKHKYMQCKWLGTCERAPLASPLPAGFSGRAAKPRASMLTYDLLDVMPVLHLTAVKVL